MNIGRRDFASQSHEGWNIPTELVRYEPPINHAQDRRKSNLASIKEGTEDILLKEQYGSRPPHSA